MWCPVVYWCVLWRVIWWVLWRYWIWHRSERDSKDVYATFVLWGESDPVFVWELGEQMANPIGLWLIPIGFEMNPTHLCANPIFLTQSDRIQNLAVRLAHKQELGHLCTPRSATASSSTRSEAYKCIMYTLITFPEKLSSPLWSGSGENEAYIHLERGHVLAEKSTGTHCVVLSVIQAQLRLFDQNLEWINYIWYNSSLSDHWITHKTRLSAYTARQRFCSKCNSSTSHWVAMGNLHAQLRLYEKKLEWINNLPCLSSMSDLF